MYIAGAFKLECDNDNCVLYHNGRVICGNCDKVLNLFLEMSITTPPVLEDLDINEEEEQALEVMLRTALLDDGNCLER